MSFLAISLPAQTLSSVANVARPLLGVSALATVLIACKSLVQRTVHIISLALKPYPSAAQLAAKRMRATSMVNGMAREVSTSQPNLAAELRMLASRD